jgi:hypothetical protein
MKLLRHLPWYSRWRWLVDRAELERELDDELAHHLAMEADAERARGLPPEPARQTALARFGGVARIKDEVRDSWGARSWC